MTKQEFLNIFSTDISDTDFNYLYNLARDASYNDFLNKFSEDINSDGTFKNPDVKNLILTIVDIQPKPIKNDLTNMAEAIQSQFPQGLKSGTNHSWKGSRAEIIQRLDKLQIKLNIQLDFDEVVDATKRYIQSFNGDYTYMQICKYFIFKNTVKNGMSEFSSALLDFIENKENVNESSNAWVDNLQ